MASRPGTMLVVFGVLAGAALLQSVGAPSRSGSEPPATPRQATPRQTQPTPGKPKPTSTSRNTHRGPDPGKVMYFTFDDGPHPEFTPKVLAVLARYRATATFFMLGREAAAYPALVAEVRRRGHTIGNHTYDHKILTLLSPERVRWQMAHGPRSRCFRPPFRETNRHIRAIAESFGMREILWDVDTKDWRKPGAAHIEGQILRSAHPGAVVLLHDGGGVRWQTVHALDRALARLSANGYRFRALNC